MRIGDYIRQQRLAADLSLEDLARMLGTQKPHISHWEMHRRVPGETNVRKLAKIFGVDAQTMLDLATPRTHREPVDPFPDQVASLMNDLADPMAIRLLRLFRGLSQQQRQNVLDVVELTTKIARESNQPSEAPLEAGTICPG